MSEKVLVVDDDPINRIAMAEILTAGGFEVSSAGGGVEALNSLAQEPFSTVLLDLVMEDMSGLEVLREIRKVWDLLALPVLMVSANHDAPPMVEALELGANDYLTKPVPAPLLIAKIRRHLLLRRDVPAPRPTPPAFNPRNNLEPGTRLGHYEILSFLGEGAMGRVYRARDVRLLRQVAIKVLCSGSEGTLGTNLERFGREALAVARISHPNVVTIFDIGQEPMPFLAMELVDGVSLGDPSCRLPFEVKRAVRYALEMLEGLSAAHAQGVIHRDLKPENVMITRQDHIKLMDFGVAKFMELEDQAISGELVGTPEYMSPEQIDPDFGRIGPRSDLFAVAAVLYYMLSGSPPFPATHPTQQLFSIVYKEPRPIHERNPAVFPALEAAVVRGLRKDPDRRFQTADQFAAALRSL